MFEMLYLCIEIGVFKMFEILYPCIRTQPAPVLEDTVLSSSELIWVDLYKCMLSCTIADQGGEGGKPNADDCWRGGEGG